MSRTPSRSSSGTIEAAFLDRPSPSPSPPSAGEANSDTRWSGRTKDFMAATAATAHASRTFPSDSATLTSNLIDHASLPGTMHRDSRSRALPCFSSWSRHLAASCCFSWPKANSSSRSQSTKREKEPSCARSFGVSSILADTVAVARVFPTVTDAIVTCGARLLSWWLGWRQCSSWSVTGLDSLALLPSSLQSASRRASRRTPAFAAISPPVTIAMLSIDSSSRGAGGRRL